MQRESAWSQQKKLKYRQNKMLIKVQLYKDSNHSIRRLLLCIDQVASLRVLNLINLWNKVFLANLNKKRRLIFLASLLDNTYLQIMKTTKEMKN